MPRATVNRHLVSDLQKQAEHRQALREAAKSVASFASTFASQAREPWMKRQSRTIEIQQDTDVTAVVNTDYAAHLSEWGSKNNSAHAPLRRAVQAAGLRFREDSAA